MGNVVSSTAKDVVCQLPTYDNVVMHNGVSLTVLPAVPRFDFIYIGARHPPESEEERMHELHTEIDNGLARLRMGGVLAVPLHGCGYLPEEAAGWYELLPHWGIPSVFW